jgi:ELWxxDGT repeat protein
MNQNTEAALWFSDGTPAGTHRIHTFSPMPGNTYEFLDGLILNGRLVFKLNNSASGGAEVWVSDGSDPGTQAVYSSSMPYYITLTRIDSLGKIFFTAGSYGGELWVTDGSAAGTLYLASNLYNIKNISDVNGRALFISYLYVNDYPTPILWVSDATSGGTQAIYTFQDGFQLGEIMSVNGRGVFASTIYDYVTGIFSSALWSSDTTSGGTQVIDTVAPPPSEGAGIFFSPTTDGSRIFYYNQGADDHDELWSTDGTVAGTTMVKQIDSLESLVWAEPKVIFTSSIVPLQSWEYPQTINLGISDGTPGGTGLIKPGQEPQGSSFPRQLTPVGEPRPSQVFFTAEDPVHGRELWIANADGSGATLVKDIYSGTASSELQELTLLEDTVFFSAKRSVDRTLWKSDGTPEGTLPVGGDYYPFELTIFDGQLYFLSFNTLWKTNGGDPQIVYTVGQWESLGELERAGNRLLLTFNQASGNGYPVTLMVSDGTGSGTTSVRDFGAVLCGKGGCTPSTLSLLTGADERLYFAASLNDGAYEMDLWTSDGTPEGTLQVSGLYELEGSSNPSLLTPHGTELTFVEDDGRRGSELWRSDGTPAGTFLLKDIFPGSTRSGPMSSGPSELTWVGDSLFFAATDPVSGRELWRYQAGANPAVRQVADLALGAGSTNPNRLAAAGDVLLFAGYDPETGNELWVSGGSAVTTRRLMDIRSGPDSSNPGEFLVAGDWVLFQANDGIHGAELWRLPVAALSRTPQAEIGTQGGELKSYLDGVSYSFGSGTFAGAAAVSHTADIDAPALPGDGWLVEAFENKGTLAPTLPYTLTVQLLDYQLGPAIESTLKLLRWDGSAWVDENFTLDADAGVMISHPNIWGVFAVVGETHNIYLPVIRFH